MSSFVSFFNVLSYISMILEKKKRYIETVLFNSNKWRLFSKYWTFIANKKLWMIVYKTIFKVSFSQFTTQTDRRYIGFFQYKFLLFSSWKHVLYKKKRTIMLKHGQNVIRIELVLSIFLSIPRLNEVSISFTFQFICNGVNPFYAHRCEPKFI